MPKNKIEHKDLLGRPLKEGSCVAVSIGNSLSVSTIKKIHPKMVKVVTLGKYNREYNKYPQDTILIDGPELSAFLLKK